MANSGYRSLVKYDRDNIDDFIEGVNNVVNNIMQGKTNNTGTCTLVASTISSVVTLAPGQLGPYTQVQFTPTTASAATEFGAGKLFVSTIDVTNKRFTVTHTSTADVDKIFQFVLVG